jgi:hypothetical protein
MHVSAAVVILGVVLEIIIAIVNPPYGRGLQRWGSLAADIMIALGVAGEVLFGALDSRSQNELRRRSNERLAEAITRAGEAHERAAKADQKAADLELQAVKLRAQLAPREINQDQYEILLTLRDKVKAVGITAFSDSESVAFARQIVKTLSRAGINTTHFNPRVGWAWTGVYVNLPRPLADYRTEPICAAFNKAGIPAGCGCRDQVPLGDLPKDLTIIMVGEKRGLPQSAPAYVHTLPPQTNGEGRR